MNPVGDLVWQAVARHGQATAFRETGRQLTFTQAGQRIARLANVLRTVGDQPGRCVAILLPNRIEYAEADLAIAVAGKVRAPVNPRLADPERAWCLANTAAETLITQADELERVAALLPELPDLRRILVLDAQPGAALPPIAQAYEHALAAASAAPPQVALPGEAPAVVRHTSGTTGRPKGAVISAAARLAALRASITHEYAPQPGDTFLHVAPMGHASGDKVLAFFQAGAANAFVASFEPERFANDCTRLEATCSFVVPTMLRMILAAATGDAGPRPSSPTFARWRSPTFARWRNLTYGGEPIDAATRQAALAHFGHCLTQIYGTTESPHPVLYLDHAAHLRPETMTVTGRAADGIELTLVDDHGAPVPRGEAGELRVRGPNVMSGYWNDPAATAEVLVDGWFHTGDIATVDEHGWYTVLDRKKDVVITGGLNVYPAEVEAALLRHPHVAEAAVFGLPEPTWGEVVAAAIVAHAGASPDLDALQAHCAALLAGYKKPRRVFYVDALPKTATGKTLKRLLREEHAHDR